METTQHTWAGAILLSIFVAFLSWYFVASYREHRDPPRIVEKSSTPHDDLLAVDGRRSGDKTAVGKFGLIFTTRDGGKTWQPRPSGTAKALTAVSFADPSHGFIVGSGGAVLASKDGGANWQPQSSGTKDQLLSVHAQSATHAFAVGAFGILLSTTDGGATWRKHELKWDGLIERIVKESGYVEPNLNAVTFSSPQNGWIVGEFGLVLHTRDGGKSWASQRYGGDLPQLYAVEFVDDRRGWAIGQGGSLIETGNGGQQWAPVKVETRRDLYDISLEDSRGVIVGDGVVLVSRDRGATWESRGASTGEQWLSGVALKSSEAIAVGGAGTMTILPVDNAPMEKESGAAR
jgi:photosystem II stability/assembly factor-like uncharacterized protein